MSIGHATTYGRQASVMPELFGTGTRYSGASLGCRVFAAPSGGFAPVVATGLLPRQGNTHAVSAFMIALALITLLAVGVAKETAGRPRRSQPAACLVLPLKDPRARRVGQRQRTTAFRLPSRVGTRVQCAPLSRPRVRSGVQKTAITHGLTRP